MPQFVPSVAQRAPTALTLHYVPGKSFRFNISAQPCSVRLKTTEPKSCDYLRPLVAPKGIINCRCARKCNPRLKKMQCPKTPRSHRFDKLKVYDGRGHSLTTTPHTRRRRFTRPQVAHSDHRQDAGLQFDSAHQSQFDSAHQSPEMLLSPAEGECF